MSSKTVIRRERQRSALIEAAQALSSWADYRIRRRVRSRLCPRSRTRDQIVSESACAPLTSPHSCHAATHSPMVLNPVFGQPSLIGLFWCGRVVISAFWPKAVSMRIGLGITRNWPRRTLEKSPWLMPISIAAADGVTSRCSTELDDNGGCPRRRGVPGRQKVAATDFDFLPARGHSLRSPSLRAR